MQNMYFFEVVDFFSFFHVVCNFVNFALDFSCGTCYPRILIYKVN
jgi:hypothetical protein